MGTQFDERLDQLHPVATGHVDEMRDAALMNDPAKALQSFLVEKQTLEAKNTQLESALQRTTEELSAAVKVAADLEPFMDIIMDTRTFLPVYLRRSYRLEKPVSKLRKKYGKLVDINSNSKTGRQAAHRRIDGVVEECIRYCLLNWHHVMGRMEALDERSKD